MASTGTPNAAAAAGAGRPDGSELSRLGRRELLSLAARGAVAMAAATPLAALGGCSSGQKSSSGGAGGQTLTVGLLAPLTGPVAPEGKAMRRGFDMAVAEVNAAGGVLGKPLEVVVEDDQGTPSVATTAARKLLQRDRVDVVFGTITGDTTIAVKQLATQAKVPFMKAILDDYLHSPLCSRYFFKLGESDYQLLEPLAPFMVERFGRRVALVGSDYSFPHSYNQTAKPLLSAAGAQVVAEEYAPLGTAEWSSVIGKLKGARPDFVLSSVVGGDAIALLKQAQSLGLLKSSEITGVSINQEFYPAVPTLMNGRWGTFRYSDQLDNAANRKFVADYRAKYSDDAPIPSVTANSYVGMHLLAKAVGAAGGTDADKIVAALAAVKLADTVYGPEEISFDPGNQVLNTNIYLAQIASGGKYTISRGAGVTADPTKC